MIQSVTNKQINEFYLLVHPFYPFKSNRSIDDYIGIWRDSISKAAENKGCYAFYYSLAAREKDIQDLGEIKEACYWDGEFELYQFMLESFGKDNLKILFDRDAGFPCIKVYYDINKMLVDRSSTFVSARGVNTEFCVLEVIEKFCDVYQIPRSNGRIIQGESVWKSINEDAGILEIAKERADRLRAFGVQIPDDADIIESVLSKS